MFEKCGFGYFGFSSTRKRKSRIIDVPRHRHRHIESRHRHHRLRRDRPKRHHRHEHADRDHRSSRATFSPAAGHRLVNRGDRLDDRKRSGDINSAIALAQRGRKAPLPLPDVLENPAKGFQIHGAKGLRPNISRIMNNREAARYFVVLVKRQGVTYTCGAASMSHRAHPPDLSRG